MASNATTAPAPDLQAERKSLRIHGVIARDLGMSIVTGHYAPGEVLNGEVAASGDLQVSRTAYREALRILAAKGLVESRPKTGTRVSARAKWHLLDPDVLSWIFAVEPDDSLLESLFELRLIVEPQAAGLAAARRTDAHLAQMLAALEGMTEHTLASEAGQLADQHFHAALLDASGNPFLASLASGVGAAVTWTTVFKQRNEPLRRDPLPEHWRVYDAVLAGDADEARRVMAELVDMAFLDTTRALAAKDDLLVPSEA
ncbi:FadR/GntR family transcriptional regulator [Sphingomonas qomolangmaensis]|uniref:FadR family transcriptional regulator n=1 Tax=Sphingomonas qomolangmaensis TaxID=2918765 RepID=A0ABY5LCJ7_9SPHN|nr:FadR/GntR family transcriptional regulator [Sphingomonas qomolangmaensis]UUL83738.1 FadR family transcriptional regulator [Sphingomonas qomolangmaensis]